MVPRDLRGYSEYFMYIKWKMPSEGLVHLLYLIKSAICYCVKENLGRTLIIECDLALARKHDPESNKVFWDIREYFNIPSRICHGQNKPVNIYFDYKNIFLKDYLNKSIQLGENIGVYSSFYEDIIKDICQPNLKKIEAVSNMRDFNLFEAAFSSYKMILWSPWMYLNFSEIPEIASISFASEIYKKAFEIKSQISKPFCCLHLRLGDMLNASPDKYFFELEKYSTVENVAKVVRENVNEGVNIYIMTNGTDEYVERLENNLSDGFLIFTKDSFNDLATLRKQDNYKLFTVEWCLAEMSDQIVSNRYWGGLFNHANLIKIGPVQNIKYPHYAFI
jgi:hypothetical protein